MHGPRSRNIQLDLLRGLAVIGVIVHHSNYRVGGDTAWGWFLNLVRQAGFLGVDLFFVLSGFLVGGLLIDEQRKWGRVNIPRFLARRGFKIYPAYLAFLAYLILLPCLRALLGDRSVIDTLWMQLQLYGPNFVFLQNYVGTNPAGHTWTLAVEEHFYLTIPFVIALALPRYGPRFFVYLAGAAVTGTFFLRYLSESGQIPAPRASFAATHHRIDALFVGVALRCVLTYFPTTFQHWGRYRYAFIASGLGVWALGLREMSGLAYMTWGILCHTLGAALILVGIYSTPLPEAGVAGRLVMPVVRLLAWIGFYSYGVYLWHVTVMRIIERYWAKVVGTGPEIGSGLWLLMQVSTVAGGVVVGVVATKLVEIPFLRLRDRWFPSRVQPLAG